MPSISPARPPESRRLDAIDAARGVAILAMIVYHFGWDLSFLKLIETNLIVEPVWRWFARVIAGSFLFLSGVSLTLAHGERFRPRAFVKRLALISGAALLVTLATWFSFPESYIFFGILHAIALCSVLALPFLRAPGWLVMSVAAFVLAAPHLFTSPALDAPWLDWLGLGAHLPVTNDYVPVAPWLSLVLAGLVAGRVLPREGAFFGWRARGRAGRAAIWAGRQSLPIYLVHQIVLLGALYGVLQITGPDAVAEARPFLAQCRADCAAQAGPEGRCEAICACVVETLREQGDFRDLLAGRRQDEANALVTGAARQCLRRSPPAP